MKFAALGRTVWLYKTIEELVQRGHQAVLICTSPSAPEYSLGHNDFKSLALKLSCPFFCDANLNQPHVRELLNSCQADIGVSVNWLSIIPPKILDLFPLGLLNAHAGELPRYRGNAAPNWAIINGESRVVLTIHQMSEKLDAGPVVLTRSFPLDENTYLQDVYNFMQASIPVMFAESLDGLQSGNLKPSPQSDDPALSLRCFPRRPEDGLIDWSRPAKHIHRLIRASSEPLGGAFSFFNQQKLIVWRARPDILPYPWLGVPGQVALVNKKSQEATVLTGEGVLVLEEVETQSHGRVPAAEALNSPRIRLGLNLADLIGYLP